MRLFGGCFGFEEAEAEAGLFSFLDWSFGFFCLGARVLLKPWVLSSRTVLSYSAVFHIWTRHTSPAYTSRAASTPSRHPPHLPNGNQHGYAPPSSAGKRLLEDRRVSFVPCYIPTFPRWINTHNANPTRNGAHLELGFPHKVRLWSRSVRVYCSSPGLVLMFWNNDHAACCSPPPCRTVCPR